jgi:hypothetical protein
MHADCSLTVITILLRSQEPEASYLNVDVCYVAEATAYYVNAEYQYKPAVPKK